jgi:hypothetical protein
VSANCYAQLAPVLATVRFTATKTNASAAINGLLFAGQASAIEKGQGGSGSDTGR